ncbi:MAG TPA: hypothetical protein VJ994_03730 [Paracoccaceae bacterium]|nr:hypothetical protein [Paracoccaceae bacterium]
MSIHAAIDPPVARPVAAPRIGLDAMGAWIFTLSVVMLPKMGLSLGDVPINVSVLVGEGLALIGWGLALAHLRSSREWLGLTLLALASVVWLGNVVYYVSAYSVGGRDLAMMVFYYFSVFGLGVAYLVMHRPAFAEAAMKGIGFGFRFLLVYALLQIVFGAEAVAIRNVTAIYDETFDEVLNRHNVIHALDSYKIMGTYNNGNIFSICLLLLAPFAIQDCRSMATRLIFIVFLNVVIIFSASLSAYIGVIIIDAMFFVFFLRHSPVAAVLAPVALAGAVYVYFIAFCQGLTCSAWRLIEVRFLDRQLGENVRFQKIDMWLESLGEAPARMFTGDMYGLDQYIFEVMPLAFAQYFGVIVLLIFTLFYFALLNPFRARFYKAGLYAYLFASLGDGVFWTTPTPYLLGVTLGLSAYLDRRERESEAAPDRTRSDPHLRQGA